MSRASGRLTLLHVSDVHATEQGLLYGAVDGLQRLRAVGEYARRAKVTPEAVIVTGDLIQRGNPGAYPAVRDALADLEQLVQAPVLTVIGNHDDPDAARVLAGHEKAHHRTVVIAGVRIIILDSSSGELGETQRHWLAQELAAPHPDGTVIALHHPPLGSPLPTLAKAGLRDAGAFLDIVEGSEVRAILAGHFHHPLAAHLRGIPVSVGPSLAYHQVMDALPDRISGHDRAMFSVVHLLPEGIAATSVGLESPSPLFSSSVPALLHQTSWETMSPLRITPLRITSVVAALGVAAIALTSCAASTSNASEQPSQSADALEAATITLYTSEPQEKADELVAAFNKIHPEVTVEVFRAGTGDLTTRVAAEQEAGKIQADVFLAADAPTFENYAAEGLLREYTPADVDALDPAVVDKEGFYVGTRIIPTVIAYNTSLVTEAPASWAELTDPEYADRIVMPNPDVSGAAAFNAAVWLDEDALGEKWLTALAANRPVIADSNGPVSQAVATGAQPVGIVVDYLVRELAAQGSPIAVSYPSEGVPFVSQPVGIFTDSENVEASEAFVDFLASVDGQKLAVEQSYLPVRSDVGTPEGAPSLDDITILSPDLETIRATQDAAVEKFRGLFLK